MSHAISAISTHARCAPQVHAPLAHALGVGKFLWELEDISFRTLFPGSYTALEQWQRELWAESEDMMEAAKDEVRALPAAPPLSHFCRHHLVLVCTL